MKKGKRDGKREQGQEKHKKWANIGRESGINGTEK